MGCMGSQAATSEQISLQLKRLKHVIVTKIDKLRAEGVSQEKLLVSEFAKPRAYRTAAAENAIATDITLKMNKIQSNIIVTQFTKSSNCTFRKSSTTVITWILPKSPKSPWNLL